MQVPVLPEDLMAKFAESLTGELNSNLVMGSRKPATVMLKRCLNSHLKYPCDHNLGRRHDELGMLDDNRRSFAQNLNCVGLGAAQ